VWLLLIAVATVVVIWYDKLLSPSKSGLLETKKELAEKVTETLRKAPCPVCGESTTVETVDLARENVARIVCKNRHTSLWKLRGNGWDLVAPMQPGVQVVSRVEGPVEVEEEEMPELVFR
jgi:transcription elongation factor Elf1